MWTVIIVFAIRNYQLKLIGTDKGLHFSLRLHAGGSAVLQSSSNCARLMGQESGSRDNGREFMDLLCTL